MTRTKRIKIRGRKYTKKLLQSEFGVSKSTANRWFKKGGTWVSKKSTAFKRRPELRSWVYRKARPFQRAPPGPLTQKSLLYRNINNLPLTDKPMFIQVLIRITYDNKTETEVTETISSRSSLMRNPVEWEEAQAIAVRQAKESWPRSDKYEVIGMWGMMRP